MSEKPANSDSRPLCLDLFCGRGGWATGFLDAGYRVVGFDISDFSKWYPGEFVRGDLCETRFEGNRSGRSSPLVVVASPPCTEFSPLTALREARGGAKRDPQKGMALVGQAIRLISEAAPRYWAIENVKGSIPYISNILGRPKMVRDSWVLWGKFPGFLMDRADRIQKCQRAERNKGPRYQGSNSVQRSLIPYPIARGLAEACLP